jgi:hypothetical protein
MLLVFETREKAGLAESIAPKEFHLRQKLSGPANQFRPIGRCGAVAMLPEGPASFISL